MKPTYVLDSETYNNVHLVGIKRLPDGKVRIYEHSHRESINFEDLRRVLMSGTVITFNGKHYDMPVIWFAIESADYEGVSRREENLAIKQISDRIIQQNIKWWDVERELGITVPRALDHIDLIEPQPNPFASLKVLNGRLHGRWMQDLPYHHDAELTDEQIDKLREYLHNDLSITEELYKELAEPLELRRIMGETIGVDLRSKSDTQMGLAIIKHRVESLTGRKIPYNRERKHPAPFKYEPPAYIRFENPVLRSMLDRLKSHTFIVRHDGKVDLPEFLLDPIRIGDTEYAMGIGGLHSTESSRSVVADYATALIDADVASYYPHIILSLGLFPEALGKVFLEVYESILNDRLKAKAAQRELKKRISAQEALNTAVLAAELVLQQAIDGGLKTSSNGSFGSLGSPYSIVYAPHLMIAVTLTGQLALLMLIEWAEARDVAVASANTDGVLFQAPRSMFAGVEGVRLNPSELADITDQWERETGFSLEFVEYRGVYSQSVNSYFAIKANGGHKRKGPLANPWSNHPDDRNSRAALMKNPQMTICSDAALARIKDGVPLEDTIRGCKDIRQFVTVIKVTKGGTWRGDYLGKVVRYYWGAAGEPIYESEANPKTGSFKTIAKTEGAVPCMTLPDEMPHDIDYNRYVQEAEKILKDVGFYGSIPAPRKTGRLTEEKLWRLLPWLLV